MMPDPITLQCDTREPWPHPWRHWLPAHITLDRATLDTGDFAVADCVRLGDHIGDVFCSNHSHRHSRRVGCAAVRVAEGLQVIHV